MYRCGQKHPKTHFSRICINVDIDDDDGVMSLGIGEDGDERVVDLSVLLP